MYFEIVNSKEYKALSTKFWQKHAKTHYRGKPTKWIQKYERMKERANEYRYKGIAALLVKNGDRELGRELMPHLDREF